MRVRGTVEYLGTDWCGWQLQPGQPTVQGELERALGVVVGSPVRVAASGRTDSGVHATGQVIAFDVAEGSDLRRLCKSINALTARSVSVLDLVPTNDAFDPRRHALSRSYEYLILTGRPPSPFLEGRCWHVYPPPDFEVLQVHAAMIPGDRDFSAFRASDCTSESTQRCVTQSSWTRDGHLLTYRVSANAFLKQMVRTLVGSMVDVARGQLSSATFAELLSGGDRTCAGRTAPADGLSLVAVEYPDEF